MPESPFKVAGLRPVGGGGGGGGYIKEKKRKKKQTTSVDTKVVRVGDQK